MSSDPIARSSPSCSAAASPRDDARRRDQAGQQAVPPPPPPRVGEAIDVASGTRTRRGRRRRARWWPPRGLGAAWALDPRARWVREWNRAYLLACAAGLMVDPLFLYTVSVSGPLMCLFLDGWLAAAVTALRCAVDAMHVWNVATQHRLLRGAAGSKRADGRSSADEERQAAAVGEEEEGEDEEGGADEVARKVPAGARSKKALMLDFFVILPVMQVRNLFYTH